MTQTASAFQLLYVSQLAPCADFSVVKSIASVARHKNSQLNVSGALLFDGERFAQLLEGDEADVRFLMNSIQGDTRHMNLVVLAALEGGRRFVPQRWSSGYCDPEELSPLDGAQPLRGPAARDVFLSVLQGADTE
jgi:Sensors of blue-light using FAD